MWSAVTAQGGGRSWRGRVRKYVDVRKNSAQRARRYGGGRHGSTLGTLSRVLRGTRRQIASGKESFSRKRAHNSVRDRVHEAAILTPCIERLKDGATRPTSEFQADSKTTRKLKWAALNCELY